MRWAIRVRELSCLAGPLCVVLNCYSLCSLSAHVERTCASVYARSVSFVLGGAEVYVRILLFAECQFPWSGRLPREYVAIMEGFVWVEVYLHASGMV